MPKAATQPAEHLSHPSFLSRNPLGEVAILFAVICLFAAEPVPGINESHYLPKAKHLFDSTFCPGDVFIESHDSHGMAAAVAGALAQFLPLSAVAWIGRALCWISLAFAWQQLRTALKMSWITGAAALASWYLAIDYGNWAGEWAIGGFEGKALAYVCIIVAFSRLFQGNWPKVWLWLGLAVAWHPLAGGWAGLTVGLAWLAMPQLLQRAKSQSLWLALGTVFGLVGVVPAALGLNSPNELNGLVASQIHAYYRLAHHLSPRMFAFDRHVAGAVTLALLAAVTALYLRYALTKRDREWLRSDSIAWILTIAWNAILLSLVGVAIDQIYSRSQPVFASQFLRFYWFRWFDVIVPLAWTLTFWRLCELYVGEGSPIGRLPKRDRSPEQIVSPNSSNSNALWVGRAGQCLGAGVLIYLTTLHTQATFARKHPAADDMLMKAPVIREIETDRYVDWLATCEWVRQNTPTDSLWFTPEYQQTFKWYAGRAEVVCWKDVPQDNASVRAWYQRLVTCRQPRNAAVNESTGTRIAFSN